MKKAISLLLAMSLLLACFVGVICIAEYTTTTETDETADSDLPKIRYYYKDSVGTLSLTDDSETFDANMKDTDSVYVIFELESPAYKTSGKEGLTIDSTDEEVETVKNAHLAEVKAVNTAANKAFMEENGISVDSDDYTVYASSYSPFIQITFKKYEDYTDYSADIVELAECDKVSSIDITIPIEFENDSATRVDSSSVGNYSFSAAISDINASDDTYDGDGITIGFVEVDNGTTDSNNELKNLTIHCSGSTTSITDHGVKVVRLACGTKGVATGIDTVYIYNIDKTGDEYQLFSAMDWLTDCGCDVINCSFSNYTSGLYYWTSAFLDYCARYWNVTVVSAAGNTGYGVADVAVGYNVVAVGATDKNNNISAYSAYYSYPHVAVIKPTVCAPGTNIKFSTLTHDSGTSYAAPMVTGVVAKLMDQYSYLKSYPEVVMAALIASATPVNGQGDEWDTYAGAGRINYEKACEAVENSIRFEYSSDSLGYRFYKDISVSKNTTLKGVMVWLANQTTSSTSSSWSTQIHTDYDLFLTTTGNSELVSSETTYNIEYIKYSNTSYSTLRFRLYQYDNKITSDKDYGAIAWASE
ncbi:MAG: S8 family serine peptidase [Clostridia bacterium]|nr:S8 family serine peptidase [Clostridia bacterium]